MRGAPALGSSAAVGAARILASRAGLARCACRETADGRRRRLLGRGGSRRIDAHGNGHSRRCRFGDRESRHCAGLCDGSAEDNSGRRSGRHGRRGGGSGMLTSGRRGCAGGASVGAERDEQADLYPTCQYSRRASWSADSRCRSGTPLEPRYRPVKLGKDGAAEAKDGQPHRMEERCVARR
jgi:hypothetical protein